MLLCNLNCLCDEFHGINLEYFSSLKQLKRDYAIIVIKSVHFLGEASYLPKLLFCSMVCHISSVTIVCVICNEEHSKTPSKLNIIENPSIRLTSKAILHLTIFTEDFRQMPRRKRDHTSLLALQVSPDSS